MLEILAAAAAELALKESFADLLEHAKGEVKERLQRFSKVAAIKSLHGKISEVGTVRTIASRQPVSIRSIYYPVRVKAGKASMEVSTISDLSDGASKHIVITGTVGQGKSVLLKYLCLAEIDAGKGLPIFIELRNTSEKVTLHDLIRLQFSNLGFGDEVDDGFLKLVFERRFVTILLDGYDEVKSACAANVRNEIHLLAARFPKLQLVVSSRPTAVSRELDRLSGFQYLEISPLAPRDFDPFLKRIGVDQETRDRLLKAIKNSRTEIRSLLTTPLMLTLLVTACGTRPALPDTLPDFYEALFGVMVATHDDTKPGYIRGRAAAISNSQLENLFKAFCFISKDEAGTTSLTPKEFSSTHAKAVQVCGHACTLEEFRSDLLDVVCLLAKDGLNIAFIHKSIQEYFASAFVADLDDEDVAKRIYDNIRSSRFREWHQELRFLTETDAHRCKKYYHIPSIKSVLALFGYDSQTRVGATLTKIRAAIKKIDPSLSYDHNTSQISIGIETNFISSNGIHEYIFHAFSGISELVEHDEVERVPLVELALSNSPLGSTICNEVRNNLRNLAALLKQFEIDVHGRKERLLAIIGTSSSSFR